MEPVGFTLFTTSRNSRLLLLLRKVIAVPLCPSRPALPTYIEGINRYLIRGQTWQPSIVIKLHWTSFILMEHKRKLNSTIL